MKQPSKKTTDRSKKSALSCLLGVEPKVHEPNEVDACKLGTWTELGEHGHYSHMVLGDYSYTGPFCFVQNAVIGKFANIAAAVRIGPTNHPIERPTLHHFTYRRQKYGMDTKDDDEFFARRRARITTVGHDTWIGHGAIVMPGVTIGNGAVVGSGAVVTKDVPPYCIAVGVPAQIIKRRFPEGLAKSLEAIGWWDWPHELLASRMDDFCGSAEEFVALYGQPNSFEKKESTHDLRNK